MKDKHILILLTLAVFGFGSCDKEKYNDELATSPQIKTDSLRAVASNSLQIGGNIISDGNSPIISRGICWSEQPDPTINSDTIIIGKGKGSFMGYVKNLKSKTKYFIRAYATNMVATSYGKIVEVTTGETITDYDGNVYNTVIIGNQTWMVENLKTTHYRNGDPLHSIQYGEMWSEMTEGSFTNNQHMGMGWDFFGNYYNWIAIHDSRNICPAGWHIPSDAEWKTLLNIVGSHDPSSKLVKENYPYHSTWYTTSNESGFSAVPAGTCTNAGIYLAVSIGDMAFWSSTESSDGNGSALCISSYRGIKPAVLSYEKDCGISVRCIKD